VTAGPALAATEADLAGAPKDTTKRMLGHAKGETTEIYRREDLEVNRELAKLRVEKRKPRTRRERVRDRNSVFPHSDEQIGDNREAVSYWNHMIRSQLLT
jgi:hypothetical protein